MKKFVRLVCVILVCGLLLAIPTQAENVATQKGSAFFSSYGTDLYKTTSSSFQVWFDVVSNVYAMDVLGASEIVIYRSADQQSWAHMRTYRMSVYTTMVDQNTSYHASYVTYSGTTSGYYYRARVTFYAKNSTGIGERDVYTEIIKM